MTQTATPDRAHARMLSEKRDELGGFLRRIEGAVVAPAQENDPRISCLQPIVSMEVARLQERLDTLSGNRGQQWRLLSEVERLTQRLATETLAVVGGSGIRATGLDNGACALADAMLATITRTMALGYEPITVPSGSEFIDVLSDVIRVRYPGTGVWDLPVVLHELGHFLVRRLRRESEPSVSTIIERERDKAPYRGYFAEELWCDVFGAYVGGPAYAFSALLRFDAAAAHEDDRPSHPSPMKRAAAIRFTLGRSQAAWRRKDLAAGSLEAPVALAEQLWLERLEASGTRPESRAEDREYADDIAREYLAILDRDLVVIRYDDARHAAAVRRGLDEGEPTVPKGAGMVDVLNGGWWARRVARAEFRDVQVITEAVSQMCTRIAGNG
jgi:hypothetical protein